MKRAQPKSKRVTSSKSSKKGTLPPHAVAWEEEWPFHFLDLPPELRNIVYEYIFTSNYDERSGLNVVSAHEPAASSVSPLKSLSESEDECGWLAILRTCRQIYDEANTIPYNRNMIWFPHPKTLVECMACMTADQVAAVTRIELGFIVEPDQLWYWGMLKLFSNLSVLRLVDEDFHGAVFLGEDKRGEGDAKAYDVIAWKIKALRGLDDFKIVPERVYAQDDSFEHMVKLTALWKPYVTQPKPGAR